MGYHPEREEFINRALARRAYRSRQTEIVNKDWSATKLKEVHQPPVYRHNQKNGHSWYQVKYFTDFLKFL
jgi:hypothetical protein